MRDRVLMVGLVVLIVFLVGMFAGLWVAPAEVRQPVLRYVVVRGEQTFLVGHYRPEFEVAAEFPMYDWARNEAKVLNREAGI
jgi:uncharacterized membrane protein